jgi:hypothetical protein
MLWTPIERMACIKRLRDLGAESDDLMAIEAALVFLESHRCNDRAGLVTATRVTAVSADQCRRGNARIDGAGNPFSHERDPGSKICVWCGDGAPPPPPHAYEKKFDGPRYETIACAEHGSHRLEIKPDGGYEKPDCEMFK